MGDKIKTGIGPKNTSQQENEPASAPWSDESPDYVVDQVWDHEDADSVADFVREQSENSGQPIDGGSGSKSKG
jgi:hypothetical protein